MPIVAGPEPRRRHWIHRLSVVWTIGRPHIVAVAAACTWVFGQALVGRTLLAAIFLTAVDWLLVNLLNRVVDLREDRLNHVDGTDAVARHRRGVTGLGLGALLLAIVLGHLWQPELTPLRLAFHALGAAYNWPILPGRRLKQRYILKNAASASGFMLTCFGFPLMLGPLRPEIGVVAVVATGAFFFLLECSYEVLYDLRDAPGDRAAGAATFAVVHGEAFAWRLAMALAVASVVPLISTFAASLLPWRIAALSIGSAVQCLRVIHYRRAGLDGNACRRLTWSTAALLAAYCLWDLAGLPGSGA